MKRLSQSGSSNFCPELRKNALLISQSHFSNFALHVIKHVILFNYSHELLMSLIIQYKQSEHALCNSDNDLNYNYSHGFETERMFWFLSF